MSQNVLQQTPCGTKRQESSAIINLVYNKLREKETQIRYENQSQYGSGPGGLESGQPALERVVSELVEK